ncbi:unnamed protein product [Owenia fusiformis]|uniref:Bms1-type G domain-containing protein n=1 Tax=Owenia fusiformis TaxID=6347 RepID=A0A8S4PQB9_OWEFU|nr:unnamed protein product [Owenia fusiformis]
MLNKKILKDCFPGIQFLAHALFKMADKSEEQSHKKHRQKQSGSKAEKKKSKNKHEQEQTDRQRNPRAFAFHSVNKVARQVRRTLDIKEKRHHVPVVDRTPVEPPPIVVAVVGPPKVGKTTLVNCLIRNFTRQKLTTIKGPVTIVSGKKRRITIIECNNDINSMIDIAKVADLVLLLVDASFGFEMETFEFLNICQVHGFPKIMGVLTHLDQFKNSKVLKKTKKRLKNRFWTEIYQGAKLFYLSGMVNGEYQKTEVHNLGRFISVMKFRPLVWRSSHPYIIADRMEDLTEPDAIRINPKVDRNISLYGYVRGTHFKNKSNIHIPGAGDFHIKDMSFLHDPCPLPDTVKKRSLNEKERLIYAPMSGVGGIVYDKDAVYIDLGGSHSHKKTEKERPSNAMVSTMMDSQQTLDAKMASSQLSLFKDTAPLTSEDIEGNPNFEMPSEEKVLDDSGRTRRKAIFDKDENDDGDDDIESDEEDDVSEVEDMELDTNIIDQTYQLTEEKQNKSTKSENLQYEDDESDDENIQLFSSKSTPKSKSIQRNKTNMQRDSFDEHLQEGSDIEDPSASEEESESDENSSSSEEKSSTESPDERTIVNTILEKTKNKLNENKTMGNKKTNQTPEILEKQNDDESDIGSDDYDNDDDDEQDMEGNEDDFDDFEEGEDMSEGDENSEDDGESEEEDTQETGHLKWKDSMIEKAAEAYRKHQSKVLNLKKLVYGQDDQKDAEDDDSEAEDEDDLGGLFKVSKKSRSTSQKETLTASSNGLDCSRYTPVTGDEPKWELEELLDAIKDCFVTGKWDKDEDAQALLDQDDEMYGDFEDLETGEIHKEEDDDGSDDTDEDDEEEDDKPKKKKSEWTKEERKAAAMKKREEKKKNLKAMFDAEYDDKDGTYYDGLKAEMEQQATLNRSEFENLDDATRAQYEGFRPGLYVRVELEQVPCELVTNFDPTYPLILGGLLSVEETIGYVQVRFKKHRWHKKILKNRDPLIVSLGWRRFQTIPLYSIQDHNMRNRLLKYTPEHMHCHATMWGPITPQGTGLLAVQSVSGNSGSSGFRIAGTGVVLELDKSKTIVKKLKLTGTPLKIFKKTAFIKGMFTSQLEVAKFEGATIKSVSGIRGQIKKAVKAPAGAFRATFEDKLQLSDIVFVRTWFPVEVPRYYNVVSTLLLDQDEKTKWQGMKTVGQLKREKGVQGERQEDSIYKKIVRKPKTFQPLMIPRDLQGALPFKDKPKVARNVRDPVQSTRIAVVKEAKERKVSEFMKMMKTLHEHKMKKKRVEMRQRARAHEKQTKIIDNKRQKKTKEMKKEIFRVLGKMEARKKSKRSE